MQKPPTPGFLEILDPIHTRAYAPDHMTPVRETSTNLVPGTFSHGTPVYYQNHNTIKSTTTALEQEYQIKSSQLPQTLEHELAITRLEGSIAPLAPVQSILRELEVRHTLTLRKMAELHSKTAIAHAFYGGDPFNRPINEFMKKATAIEKRPVPNGIAMQALFQSMRAAHDARLLSQGIELLGQQNVNVQNFLRAVQANEDAAAQAREQARLAALEAARQAAVEQARIAAQAAAQQIAAERALLEAQAEVKRQEEKAREEQEEKQRKEADAKKDAQELERFRAMVAMFKAWEAAKVSRPFPVSGRSAAAGPVFTLAAGRLATGVATTQAVRSALHTAVAAAIMAGSAAASAVLVGFAALMFPSPLADGERRSLGVPLSNLVPDNLHAWSLSLSDYQPNDLHALSIPLSDLVQGNLDDLYAVAQISGEIRLPVAIGSRTTGNITEFFVAATNETTLPVNVPVRLATYDPAVNVYRSYNPDAPSIGMTWTPIVLPNGASTTLPASEPNIAVYDGTTPSALEGRLDEFPELDLYSFGGFITVFPAESGIPPIFTMFRDRRSEPGVASGYGQLVSGNWVAAASTQEGAPVPKQIADKLRGREFSSFKAFRREFWKAVAADHELSSHLSRLSKIETKKGLAAKAPSVDHVGQRTKYELHHLTPISEDGAVYDIDNIKLLTPRQHMDIHSHKGDK
ncbi:S-type pyocin domain-containing protein [Pseudomonas sp. NPDC086278]|uniref:S-type pyocin domain-containing protein n=1 Tax=Pseudomonas sp. NPDC086278 TaxID=3390646 RepID=UPI003CFE56EB